MQKYDEAKIKAMQAANLAKAIEYAGGQARLAKYLGVASHQVVHNWVQRGRISATCAKKVEELTGGKIKKEQLRPDVIVWTADK